MVITVIAIILTIALAIYLFCGVVMTIKEDISSYKEEKKSSGKRKLPPRFRSSKKR